MNKSKIITISIAGLLVLCIFLMAILSPNDVYVHTENSGKLTGNDSVSGQTSGKINVDLYLECSGSMHGYMNNYNSKFKDAINGCLSVLNATNDVENFRLYWIGKNVHPFDTCFTLNKTNDLLQKYLKPSYFGYNSKIHKSENPNSGISREDNAESNLYEMLDTIIDRTKNDVSVFISDCILDPYKNANPEDFLNFCETELYNLFNNKLSKNSELAVQIIQLDSKFTGNYYTKEGSVYKEGDVFPYYIWIIGNAEYISKFNEKIDRFKDYNQSNNDVNSVAFVPKQTVDFEIEKSKLIVRDDTAKFKVIADFSKLLGYKDSLDYDINNDKFKIVNRSFDDKTKKKTINIKLGKVRPNLDATIVCEREEKLPEWVEKEGSTGIKHMLNGISRAYADKFGNVLVEMKIKTSYDSPGKINSNRTKETKEQKKKQKKELNK